MKSLERRIFRRDFIYRQKFINTCIMRIKYGHRSERTIRGYKMYIFKMMHDIIKKNICNYINLLMNGTNLTEIPKHDDVLTDVYIMFDKCLDKYKVSKGRKFYYYFNKSLSRNFYREYQRIQKRTYSEAENVEETIHPNLRYNEDNYTVGVLMDNLGFTDTEKRIVESRLKGQYITEFLKENTDVTQIQYANAMKRMKDLILRAKKGGKW